MLYYNQKEGQGVAPDRGRKHWGNSLMHKLYKTGHPYTFARAIGSRIIYKKIYEKFLKKGLTNRDLYGRIRYQMKGDQR